MNELPPINDETTWVDENVVHDSEHRTSRKKNLEYSKYICKMNFRNYIHLNYFNAFLNVYIVKF